MGVVKVADFWICDIHDEHGPSSFHPCFCSGCAEEWWEKKLDKAFEEDFHEWRQLREMRGTPHVKLQGHGYLPDYHFEIVTKNLVINKPMVYGKLDEHS